MTKKKKSASPLEMIREGIKSANWELVSEGYQALTGEEIHAPDRKPDDDANDCLEAIRVMLNEYYSFEKDTHPQDQGEESEKEDVPFEPEQEETQHLPAKVRPEKMGWEEEEATAEPVLEEHKVSRSPTIEERARAAREARGDVQDFHIEHKNIAPQISEKGKSCKVLPWEKGKVGKNKFQDDKTIAPKEILIDQKLSGKLTPSERRPEVPNVDVKCFRCDKTYSVPPVLVPKRMDATDEAAKYICDSCLRRGGRNG